MSNHHHYHVDLIPTHDNMQLMQVIAQNDSVLRQTRMVVRVLQYEGVQQYGRKKVELSLMHNDIENASDTYSLYASQSSPDRQDIHIPLWHRRLRR